MMENNDRIPIDLCKFSQAYSVYSYLQLYCGDLLQLLHVSIAKMLLKIIRNTVAHRQLKSVQRKC